jgi:hypothetical protein
MFAALPLAATECETLAACLAAAKKKQAVSLEVLAPSVCGDDDRGCLAVEIDGTSRIQSLPSGYLVGQEPLKKRQTPVLLGLTQALKPLEVGSVEGLSGADGMTVAVRFFASAPRVGGVEGLFSLADRNHRPLPDQLAIGRDAMRFYLGTRSSFSGQWVWVPLWDPVPGTGWFTLFVTYQPDGKTRFDLYSAGGTADGPISLISSVVDFGWPIKNVPQGNGLKTFLPVNFVSLGAGDVLAEGLSRLQLFRQPLSANERRAVHTEELASGNLPFDGPKEACNTGSYLNDRPYQQSLVPTVCGVRSGTLYAVSLPGEYWPHYTHTNKLPLYVTPADPPSFQYLDNKSIFPGEQKITFESAGNNYFYVHHMGLFRDGVWTLNGDDVSISTVKNTPHDPKQLWFIEFSEDMHVIRIKSAANGEIVTAPFEWLARVKTNRIAFDPVGWQISSSFDPPSIAEQASARRAGRNPAWRSPSTVPAMPGGPLLPPSDPVFDSQR